MDLQKASIYFLLAICGGAGLFGFASYLYANIVYREDKKGNKNKKGKNDQKDKPMDNGQEVSHVMFKYFLHTFLQVNCSVYIPIGSTSQHEAVPLVTQRLVGGGEQGVSGKRLSGGARTRHQFCTKLGTLVGPGKEFVMSEVPTLRAVIQKGILIKESMMIETGLTEDHVNVVDLVKEVTPLVLAQWQRANAKFVPPVTITEKSLRQKLEKLWRRVDEVAKGRGKGINKREKEKVMDLLDKLIDVTTCPHTILSCSEEGSGCGDMKECKVKAHVQCSCPLQNKVPVLDLNWLKVQRAKRSEMSEMMMARWHGGDDKKETERQQKAAKRKAKEDEMDLKRKKKAEEDEEKLLKQDLDDDFAANMEEDGEEKDEDEEIIPSVSMNKEEEEEVKRLVDRLLEERLGDKVHLVVRYLGRPGPRRNTIPVPRTARSSLRYFPLTLLNRI